MNRFKTIFENPLIGASPRPNSNPINGFLYFSQFVLMNINHRDFGPSAGRGLGWFQGGCGPKKIKEALSRCKSRAESQGYPPRAFLGLSSSIGSSASNPILRGTYAKLPINLGNRPRVRQEHFPNFLGPKSDHNGFFYGR